MPTTAERLTAIEQSLARIELALQTRVPLSEIRQAIEDVFATYGLVAQLKEVYSSQRDDVAQIAEAVELLTKERSEEA